MKKITIAILSSAALLGGFLIFYQSRSIERKAPNNDQIKQQTSAEQNWESKTDVQALVAVTVTPIDISPQSKEWKFDIIMDTHSVELDQDMIKTSVLIDDRGKEYKPLNWKGQTGGHHREGVLAFNQIIPAPKFIELKIFGAGDVVRSFSWQLHKFTYI